MAAHAFDLMTLLDAPGVGPGRVRKLLKRWRNTPEVAVMEDRLIESVLTPAQIAALPECRDRVRRHWDELLKHNVRVLSIIDPDYPEGLRNALGESAPVLLLCQGNFELLKRISVGFCGSREASEKGMATARDSATLLAHDKINIVSGFASGVDMNAHRAALVAGGTTTVVLAEGLLRFRVKKEIRDVWDETRTLIVSEFGPNLPWSVSHAMQRNKTICGLSRAMVLIEARSTGGSIEAGRDCLKMGLPLFAAVYEGSPESATGNEELLRNGAKRLMKSRSRDLPNMAPIMEAIANPPAAPTKQQTIERRYFEMFRKTYSLPPGDIIYADKPDVLINGTPTLGIEITNFYVTEGASPASEQVQSKLRKAAVIEGHRLYQESGGKNIDLTFSFDKKNPIKNVKTLAKQLASLGRRVEGGANGAIRKDVFKDIPELDFAYLYAQELQFSDEPDPKFPNGQPDPYKDFAAYAEYRNRREASALEAGVYKPLQSPRRWKVGQGHSFGLMSTQRLTEIVAEKEAKAQQYIACDAYWLLIIVDFIDAAQEQEIRIDGLTVESKMFQKILIYKPNFEHIVEVGIR